jgi:hypothetical protein
MDRRIISQQRTCIVIEFPCPTCGAVQRAADHLAGRTLRCQSCRGRFTVPAASAPPPAPPAEQDPAAAEDIFGDYRPKKTTGTGKK